MTICVKIIYQRSYSIEKTLLVEIINRLQSLLKWYRIVRRMEVQDINLLRLQRGQGLPELFRQILLVMTSCLEGEHLCRDFDMSSNLGGQLREDDFAIAVAVEAGSVNLCVAVGDERCEERSDCVDAADFAGRICGVSGVQAECHCAEDYAGDVGSCHFAWLVGWSVGVGCRL